MPQIHLILALALPTIRSAARAAIDGGLMGIKLDYSLNTHQKGTIIL